MKQVFQWGLLASLAFVGASRALVIQKCVGPDGKVSFQNAPCANGGGEKLRIRPATGQASGDSAAADAQLRAQKMQRDNEMSAAIRMHKPLVGMTVAELEQAMGMATKVNAANYSGQQHHQVIYERA